MKANRVSAAILMAAATGLGVILLHLLLRPRSSELEVTDQQEDIERQRQRFIGVCEAISSPEGAAQRAAEAAARKGPFDALRFWRG